MDMIQTILAWMNASGAVRRYKRVEDGYLILIGEGSGGTEITAAEYDRLAALIAAKPAAPEGWDYRLTAGLEWELCELPPVPGEDPEDEPLDPARALELICGTSSLTKTQADAFSAKLAGEERKEKREE